MRTLLFVLFGMLFSFSTLAEPTYTVGVKEAKPFAYKEDGKWKGYSIDLLERVSKEAKFNYTFKEGNSVVDLINMAKSGQVDLAISAISTTADRERQIDFSHPYFSTTQGILVKQDTNVVWWIIKQILVGMIILITGLYVVGFIVSRMDTQDDIDNVHKGAWWALVTFTTTGYGDMVPGNARGKVVASIWMIVSLFLLSAFTGYIASSLTVKRLTDAPTTIQSLYDAKVVVLEGSNNATTLSELGISYTTTKTAQEALDMVDTKKASAFVYDKAMLDFLVKTSDNDLEVWPINKGQERYAIVMPIDSKLRKNINISILDIVDSASWKSVTAKYFDN